MERLRAMGCDVAVAGGAPATVAAVLERWEAFSLCRAESELSRVNRSPARVLAVSSLFARALEVALDVAAETEGLVDPTLCGRWPEVVLSGWMLSRPPGLTLDLNGVVKALAVDEAAATLDRPGFVSVGGDLAVRGPVWLEARGIPGRFVGVDGEIVESGEWQRATQAVQACT